MLNVGDAAPDFTLQNDSGEDITLDALLAPGPIVLYFYPRDFTPVCTAEACMFRDAGAELAEAGVRVVGVSSQGKASHERFKRTFRLNFTLLSDPEKKAARAYGVVGLFGLPIPFFTSRVTYLISKDKRILDRICAEVSLSAHQAFVKRVLKAMSAANANSAPTVT